jgi:hypothetical protein
MTKDSEPNGSKQLLGGSIHDGTLLHYEIQYTTVNYNQ